MVLDIAYAAISAVLPSQYWLRVGAALVVLYAFRAFAQGRKTTRERDLHAKVVLLTGAFTPLGLTLLNSLAERGAHVIALSPEPITSPRVDILVSLLRSTTKNESIFAEECDLTSAESVRTFCTRFLTSEDNKLDAIVFAHEYIHIGPICATKPPIAAEKRRQALSLATFLMTTLLLPVLLVAPSERDIRILNIVNPFYAAAVTTFSATPNPTESTQSIFVQEGRRSLQTIIVTRHLQRILDSLPQGSQAPTTEENVVPVVNTRLQKSNIVTVSVSPGFSRADTIAPLFAANWTEPLGYSKFGVICYILLQPLLRIFAKSTSSSMETVLHALFLPTPFKSAPRNATEPDELTSEVLKPGSLYANCAVLDLKLRAVVEEDSPSDNPDVKGKNKQKESNPDALPDDGELGGEVLGRRVWENFEQALKVWEQMTPAKPETNVRTEEKPPADIGTSETSS